MPDKIPRVEKGGTPTLLHASLANQVIDRANRKFKIIPGTAGKIIETNEEVAIVIGAGAEAEDATYPFQVTIRKDGETWKVKVENDSVLFWSPDVGSEFEIVDLGEEFEVSAGDKVFLEVACTSGAPSGASIVCGDAWTGYPAPASYTGGAGEEVQDFAFKLLAKIAADPDDEETLIVTENRVRNHLIMTLCNHDGLPLWWPLPYG